MPTYAMNIFLLPRDFCDEIEKLMNGFLWKGSKFDQKGLRWRRWDLLCKPKGAVALGFRKLRDFNLAMLAKQGWSLITDARSLMARVLKARYFPGTSILKARLGNNPSFIWRSIFETQEILEKNVRRRVGNGKDIHVWADAWHPGQGTGMIQSSRPVGIRDMGVAAPRDFTEKNWNREKTASTFNKADSDLILSILISLQDREDGYWWTGEKNGCFSVKSCYRKVVDWSSTASWNGWSTL
ncbi:unnamed protein product [Cuscuta europaea]|uniref:Uncharacterized protein n=1 Tax=Cuscuta europaea TaxID=41803 RepID=A0A9P1EIM4_CUSEU|nr:unnamed protein product [Cuscuta europaea]